MRAVVLFVLVCLLSITAVSVWAAVDANASICPSMKQSQKRTIVKAFRQKYKGKTVASQWLLTDHGKNGYLVIQVFNWPKLILTVKIPVQNNCARPLFGNVVPQWWPSGVPYPGTP